MPPLPFFGPEIGSRTGHEMVAVTWDQVEVRNNAEMIGDDTTIAAADEALQDEPPEPAEEETPEVAETPAGDALIGDEGVVLVYSGAEADLNAETSVDAAILDETGALVNLDDLGLEAAADATDTNVVQLSEFDYNLINQNDEDLGEIEGLIIDIEQGAVVYAISDIGGFLEVAENTIAVPWTQLQFNETEESFVLNATEEQLAGAPTINFDEWNQGMAPDVDWNADIDTYWEGVETGVEE